MELHRKIKDNTMSDMRRYGWVVMDYDHLEDAWVGRDDQGNTWKLGDRWFMDSMRWSRFEINDKYYRCIKSDDLKKAGAEMIPKRNANDTRN